MTQHEKKAPLALPIAPKPPWTEPRTHNVSWLLLRRVLTWSDIYFVMSVVGNLIRRTWQDERWHLSFFSTSFTPLFFCAPLTIFSLTNPYQRHTHERWNGHYPKNNSNKNRKNGGNQPFFSSKINNPTQEPRTERLHSSLSMLIW